jgi:hypothetical protein
MIEIRRLDAVDLVTPPASEAELALAAAVARALRRDLDGVISLPPLGSLAGAVGIEVGPTIELPARIDGDEVVSTLSSIAWAGGTVFSIDAPSSASEQSIAAPVSSVADLRGRILAGAVIRAEHAQLWSADLGRLHDLLTRVWRARCELTVMLSSTEFVLPAPQGLSLVTPLVGATSMAALDEPDAGVGLEQGRAIVRPSAGEVELTPHGLAAVLEVSVTRFDHSVVLASLRRRAGYEPLFRADLPITNGAPPRSYAGSLLDSPEHFGRSVLAVYDDGVWDQAQAWWDAHLQLAPGPLDLAREVSPAPRVVFAAPPAFLARRLLSEPSDESSVLATRGQLMRLDGEHTEQMIRLVDGSLEVSAADRSLVEALRQIDLLRAW